MKTIHEGTIKNEPVRKKESGDEKPAVSQDTIADEALKQTGTENAGNNP